MRIIYKAAYYICFINTCILYLVACLSLYLMAMSSSSADTLKILSETPKGKDPWDYLYEETTQCKY